MSRQPPYIPDIPVERKQEIVDLLNKRGIGLAPCRVCGYDQPGSLKAIDVFEVYAHDLLVIPQPPNQIASLPNKRNWRAVAVICKKCGFRSEFDLNILEQTHHPHKN